MDFNTVATFGLSDEQNAKIVHSFPQRGYELKILKADTAIIAETCCFAAIVNAAALTAETCDTLFSYYREVAAGLYETIFWIGDPKPPKGLQKIVKCYDHFEAMEVDLKYLFLRAHRRMKGSKVFSEKIADCLRILSEIRKKPMIGTGELSQIVERSERTVQRYITALINAGEWIAYDNARKGWYLEHGKSILFGDPFND